MDVNDYTLLEVKQVMVGALLYRPTMEVPSQYTSALSKVFERTIYNFNEAYTNFINLVKDDSASYDYWVSLVLNTVTFLGNDYNSKLELLKNTVTKQITSIPGWDGNAIGQLDNVGVDYWILLGMRVYGNFITDMTVEFSDE